MAWTSEETWALVSVWSEANIQEDLDGVARNKVTVSPVEKFTIRTTGTLLVRSRYGRGSVVVQSRCTVAIRSRYGRGSVVVRLQYGRGAARHTGTL